MKGMSERKPGSLVDRRRALAALGGLFGGALAAGGTGCSFFFPVPHDSEATAEPSHLALAMGKNFTPGEQWLAEVTVEGILAGELALIVGPPCRAPDGRRVFTIRSSGHSAGMIKVLANAWSDVKTSIDAATGQPIRTVADVYDGKVEKHFEIDYGKSSFASVYQRRPTGKVMKGSHPTPEREHVHDVHSIVGMLRNWRPEDGTSGYFLAVIGRNLWRSDLRFMGRERLDTMFGEIDAIRIDGLATRLTKKLEPSTTKPKAFRVWFADDDRRLPVKVWGETKYAVVEASLVGYTNGTDPVVGTPPLPRPPDPATCPSLEEPEPLAMLHRARTR